MYAGMSPAVEDDLEGYVLLGLWRTPETSPHDAYVMAGCRVPYIRNLANCRVEALGSHWLLT